MRVDVTRGALIIAGRLYHFHPSLHSKGYATVQLGVGHPWANSGGWQYLHRILMFEEVGAHLDTHLHVHHRNGDKLATDPAELQVMHDTEHGRYHYGRRLGCGHERPAL